MDNPAQTLLELVEKWQGAGNQPPETYRQAGTAGNLELWRVQNKAVSLLAEVERILDEIESVDPGMDVAAHREDLVGAYQAVYGYEPAWKSVKSSGAARQVLPDNKPLRRIAALIRTHQRHSGVPVRRDRTALLEALGEALDELNEANYLKAEVRAHLITLVQRTIELANDDASTDEQVRSGGSEVGGMLVAAAATGAPKEKARLLFRLGGKVLEQVLVSLGVEGAHEALGAGGDLIDRLIEQ